MRASELLKGHWLEYSGGSRPGTNRIRFVELDPDNALIELWYVFDWNTNEIADIAFYISRGEFDQLVDGLLREGCASLSKSTEDQRLSFEWKHTEGGFAFRLTGYTTKALEGSIGLEIRDYKNVECGKLV